MKLQYITSGVGVALALVAGAGIYSAMKQEKQTVPVIVAKHDIPLYSQISAGDLTVVMVSPKDRLADADLSPKDIIGHMAGMTIPANTQIQKHEISPATSYQEMLAQLDRGNQNLVMVNLPSNDDGFTNVLNPGDKVILETPSYEVTNDVTVLSAPRTNTSSNSFSSNTNNAPFIVAMPLASYNEIKNQLSNVQVLVTDPNDTYVGSQQSSNTTEQTQVGNNGTSSGTTTTTATNEPQYFAPPATGGK